MQRWSVALVAAVMLVSCGPPSPRSKQILRVSKNVEGPVSFVNGVVTHGAFRPTANITMAGGDLHVFVGASGPLAEAEFQFDWNPMRPELTLVGPEEKPVITVAQPDLPERPERSENVWKIALDGSRVSDLAVTQGVGAAEITVVGSAVESINLRLGTGVMTVDLTRVVRSLAGHIEQNNGRLVLKLPRQHGVKVHRKLMAGYAMLDGVEQKDATWTSANYEAAPVKVDLDVLVFAGELEMTTE